MVILPRAAHACFGAHGNLHDPEEDYTASPVYIICISLISFHKEKELTQKMLLTCDDVIGLPGSGHGGADIPPPHPPPLVLDLVSRHLGNRILPRGPAQTDLL